jgi:protein SCO1
VVSDRRNAIKNIAAYALWTPTIGLFSSKMAGCSESKAPSYSFASIDITGAEFAKGFSLKDSSGKLRTLTEFQGKAVVVFFGFVQCPDVCPTTLAELAEVKKLLGARGDKLQTVFITVDPERDTAQVMSAYMANFDSSAIALIPTLEELEGVAKEFKVYYKKVPGKTPTSYTMDHTASGWVFDPQGRVRLVARYGMGAKALASDIEQLLKG